MAKTSSKRNISLSIRKLDNGYSLDFSSYSYGGDYSGSCCSLGSENESESWKKIAKTEDDVIDLVKDAFGFKD